jgi:thymidylate synthase
LFADLPVDSITDQGAYGPRLFGGSPNQIENVIAIIKGKPDTRQAVAQIFEAADVRTPIPNVPCTCTLQFFPRKGVLHMLTSMRSNDAYRGLPHDVFAFTLIQELVARSTNHEVGLYNHSVGSLHLYDDCEKNAREFMAEGVQDQLAVPPMPSADPWSSVRWLLEAEALLRSRCPDLPPYNTIEPYWVDLARLLRIRQLLAKGQLRDDTGQVVIGLALEVTTSWWPTNLTDRDTQVYPRDGHRQPAVGSAADPRRVA